MYGELVPVGGGDPIPLLKKSLLVGRRESCDIVLRFSNVSAHHCQLTLNGGYWYVKDMNSRNGLKVNGLRVIRKAAQSWGRVGDRQAHVRRAVLAARSGGRRPAPDRRSADRLHDTILARTCRPEDRPPRAGNQPGASARSVRRIATNRRAKFETPTSRYKCACSKSVSADRQLASGRVIGLGLAVRHFCAKLRLGLDPVAESPGCSCRRLRPRTWVAFGKK